jgi:hypothetical protein
MPRAVPTYRFGSEKGMSGIPDDASVVADVEFEKGPGCDAVIYSTTLAMAIDLLRRLTEHGENGPVDDRDQCFFCDGVWMGRDNRLRHADDCPWSQAKAFLESLK